MKIAVVILVAILLSSSLSVGNVLALTPVANLTGQWSGYVEIIDPGNCKYTGNLNAQITQNGNNMQFTYNIVVTSKQPLQNNACGEVAPELWPSQASGSIDGSHIRVAIPDGSLIFDGTYTSSGIHLDLIAESITGYTQLYPTNFTPTPSTPPGANFDFELHASDNVMNVNPGGTTGTTILVGLLKGQPNPVSLSLTARADP